MAIGDCERFCELISGRADSMWLHGSKDLGAHMQSVQQALSQHLARKA
jgi:hypothetical protein